VAKFTLTRAKAKERVRALSEKSARTAKLIWTEHIQQRMETRGIDSDAVLRILRQGDIDDDPSEGENPGDWKIKLVLKLPTGRVAGVVAVITRNDCLVLITAEWEDHQ
jgi:hypothetical protein